MKRPMDESSENINKMMESVQTFIKQDNLPTNNKRNNKKCEELQIDNLPLTELFILVQQHKEHLFLKRNVNV